MLDHIKIMQFADGTLDPNESEKVRRQIEQNPEYQKILNDYMQTGDLLNNLGNEIKSLDLPKDLKNKLYTFNQNSKLNIKNNKKFYNIFSIFNFKYSAIAAAFAIFFVSGFYTNQLIPISKNEIEAQQLSYRTDIKLRGSNTEFITSFYNWFDEDNFINEVNLKINKLKKGDKFTLKTKDKSKREINFVIGDYVENTNNKCRITYYDKLVSLQNSSKSFRISLTICNDDDEWTLKQITLN